MATLAARRHSHVLPAASAASRFSSGAPAPAATASRARFVEADLHFEGGEAKTRIWSGRGEQHSIDRHGFQLLKANLLEHPVDWYDPPKAAEALFPLAEEAVHDLFPDAKKVFIFDHIARNAARVQSKDSSAPTKMGLVDGNGLASELLAAPALMVHGDYTARSGCQRVKEILGPFEDSDRIAAALAARVVLVNLWVPLKRVERNPLAVVDWATASPEDVMRVKRIHPHRVGEIYHGLPSQRQKWVYFPDMEPGEVLAFKTFDSETDGRARFTIHSAFEDPTSVPDAPPRESIEVRCIALFGELPDGFAATFAPPHLDPNSPDHDLTPPKLEMSGPHQEW
mmetsp:Transcript_11572/g.26926  ORF Transcript_11572/g.26926 Transcript_11572/m.26926 type:complete len:340 (-) Transcript_11572:184-1203(-)